MLSTLTKLNTMANLRHFVLLSTIFSPALSSAINHPRQYDPGYPPDIPPWVEPTETSIETIVFGTPTETETSFEPSGTLPGHLFPIVSLQPCTTTYTSIASARPCPPPEWDGTLTEWPSTTTLFKPINCNGCMYVSVTKGWAVGCPNQQISATVLAVTPSTTWSEVCSGAPLPTSTAGSGYGAGAGAGAGAGDGLVVTRPPVQTVPPPIPSFLPETSTIVEEITFN